MEEQPRATRTCVMLQGGSSDFPDNNGSNSKFKDEFDDLLIDLNDEPLEVAHLDEIEEQATQYFASQRQSHSIKAGNGNNQDDIKNEIHSEMRRKISELECELQVQRSRACLVEIAANRRSSDIELGMQKEINRLKSVVQFQQQEISLDRLRTKPISPSFTKRNETSNNSVMERNRIEQKNEMEWENMAELDVCLSKMELDWKLDWLEEMTCGSSEKLDELTSSENSLKSLNRLLLDCFQLIGTDENPEASRFYGSSLNVMKIIPKLIINDLRFMQTLNILSDILVSCDSFFPHFISHECLESWIVRVFKYFSINKQEEIDESNLFKTVYTFLNISEVVLISPIFYLFVQKPVCLLETLSKIMKKLLECKKKISSHIPRFLSLFNLFCNSLCAKNDKECITSCISGCDCISTFFEWYTQVSQQIISLLRDPSACLEKKRKRIYNQGLIPMIQTLGVLWRFGNEFYIEGWDDNVMWISFLAQWTLGWISDGNTLPVECVKILENIAQNSNTS